MKKTQLFFVLIAAALTGCASDPGQNNAAAKNFWVFLVLGFIAWFMVGTFKKAKQLEIAADQKKDFEEIFFKTLALHNIRCEKSICVAPLFGLAILDDKEGIAVKIPGRQLIVLPKEKIISSSLVINNLETVISRTKTPIVSINTLGNTKGTITKSFHSANVEIMVDDQATPFIKLKFNGLHSAEQYNAYINLIILSKAGRTA